MKSILIGADPELFVVDINSNRFISSIGKFGGTKRDPLSIGNQCYLQEDNVALEFNIPPSKLEADFIQSITYSLNELSKRAKLQDLSLSIVATANFDQQELAEPKAKIFGCDPDYNAWTSSLNPAPTIIDPTLRSAGGHIHVGCKEFQAFEIARTMDLFHGVPSVLLDPNTKRRELYGKAGACRRKSYGVEYRVLSNFWLRATKLQSWAFRQVHEAINFLRAGNGLSFDEGLLIQECINTSNISLATKIMEKYGLGLGTVI